METDFIYWRHPTPAGIKVEEVCGGEIYRGKVWKELALQVYCENGKDDFRIIDHFPSGAPFLENSKERISITHTDRFLAIATIPVPSGADLQHFSPDTALGIDAEKVNRQKVLNIRERFLSERELTMIPGEDVEMNILAWTIKEALYKCALTPGIDFRNALSIISLPKIDRITDFRKSDENFGKGKISFPSGEVVDIRLYSYLSEDCIVTLAFV